MKLYKYQCNQNDFLITEYKSGYSYSEIAKLVCNRKQGFGSDGLIVYLKYPYRMLFFNQDGSKATMCGNGIRALGMHLHIYDKAPKSFDIVSGTMKITLVILDENSTSCNIKAYLGYPTPYLKGSPIVSELNISSTNKFKLYQTQVGTPHTIVIAKQISDISLEWITRQAESLSLANKSNLSVIARSTDASYYIKTYEKGVGFTSSCATAAASAYAILKHLGSRQSKIQMISDGGVLDVMGEDIISVEGKCVFVGECSYVADKK